MTTTKRNLKKCPGRNAKSQKENDDDVTIDFGHWLPYNLPDDLSNLFGFVYRITDINTQQYYIGQKRFWVNQKLKPLKGKVKSRRKRKQSDWPSYTSSGTLKDQIEADPSNFKFEILQCAYNANELNILEIEHIVQHGRDPLCANEFVARGCSYKALKCGE